LSISLISGAPILDASLTTRAAWSSGLYRGGPFDSGPLRQGGGQPRAD